MQKEEIMALSTVELWAQFHEHAEWMMYFMEKAFPNDFEMVIGPISCEIKSTLTAKTYLRPDMWYNPDKNKETTKSEEIKEPKEGVSIEFAGDRVLHITIRRDLCKDPKFVSSDAKSFSKVYYRNTNDILSQMGIAAGVFIPPRATVAPISLCVKMSTESDYDFIKEKWETGELYLTIAPNSDKDSPDNIIFERNVR